MTKPNKLFPPLAKPGTPSVSIYIPVPVPVVRLAVAPVIPWDEVLIGDMTPVIPDPVPLKPKPVVLRLPRPVPSLVGHRARILYHEGHSIKNVGLALDHLGYQPTGGAPHFTPREVRKLLRQTPWQGLQRRSWKSD
jgi:hypothetical protein